MGTVLLGFVPLVPLPELVLLVVVTFVLVPLLLELPVAFLAGVTTVVFVLLLLIN